MICKKDVEDIHHVNYAMDARMVAYPVKEPYAIYDKSKYEYELKDNSIVIKDKSNGKPYPFLKVIYQSKSGAILMLDSLEEQLKDFDEEGLTALQYELDMFCEDFDEFLLEKAGVLKDKAKHHYTKHEWQHMR